MERDVLIKQVALRMDEVTPDEEVLVIPVDGADDANPLYELIDALVDDGMLELFSVAPYWRLPQTPFDATNEIKVEAINSADTESRKIIRLKLNGTFLRVAEILCSDFQRPITEVVPEQSPEGRRQHNRYLMAKTAKPVGVLSHGIWGEGQQAVQCREIDCYSLANDTTVTESSGIFASYIATPDNVSDVPDTLIYALEWIVAGMAFGARGDAGHEEICRRNASNLLV